MRFQDYLALEFNLLMGIGYNFETIMTVSSMSFEVYLSDRVQTNHPLNTASYKLVCTLTNGSCIAVAPVRTRSNVKGKNAAMVLVLGMGYRL